MHDTAGRAGVDGFTDPRKRSANLDRYHHSPSWVKKTFDMQKTKPHFVKNRQASRSVPVSHQTLYVVSF